MDNAYTQMQNSLHIEKPRNFIFKINLWLQITYIKTTLIGIHSSSPDFTLNHITILLSTTNVTESTPIITAIVLYFTRIAEISLASRCLLLTNYYFLATILSAKVKTQHISRLANKVILSQNKKNKYINTLHISYKIHIRLFLLFSMVMFTCHQNQGL